MRINRKYRIGEHTLRTRNAEERTSEMLSDLYLGRSYIVPGKMDMHRHATFSCGMAKLAARVKALFRRS
jgi:hypothetical protein